MTEVETAGQAALRGTFTYEGIQKRIRKALHDLGPWVFAKQ